MNENARKCQCSFRVSLWEMFILVLAVRLLRINQLWVVPRSSPGSEAPRLP